MTNERDTHFAGFAKLLWHEVRKTSFDSPGFSHYQQLEEHLQLLFAQRAYDLARHIIWEAMGGTPNAIRIIVADVPDLTAWPDTSPPS